MEGMMKTAVMTGIGQMAFEERPIPKPKDDEALIRIEYVGVCGSDLHYYESACPGRDGQLWGQAAVCAGA